MAPQSSPVSTRRLLATLSRADNVFPQPAWSALIDLLVAEPFGPYVTMDAHLPDTVDLDTERPYEAAALEAWRDAPEASLRAIARPDDDGFGMSGISLARYDRVASVTLWAGHPGVGSAADIKQFAELFEQVAITLGGPVIGECGAVIDGPDLYDEHDLEFLPACLGTTLQWRHVVTRGATERNYRWADVLRAPVPERKMLSDDMMLFELYPSPFEWGSPEALQAIERLTDHLLDVQVA